MSFSSVKYAWRSPTNGGVRAIGIDYKHKMFCTDTYGIDRVDKTIWLKTLKEVKKHESECIKKSFKHVDSQTFAYRNMQDKRPLKPLSGKVNIKNIRYAHLKSIRQLRDGKCIAVIKNKRGEYRECSASYNSQYNVVYLIYYNDETVVGYIQ